MTRHASLSMHASVAAAWLTLSACSPVDENPGPESVSASNSAEGCNTSKEKILSRARCGTPEPTAAQTEAMRVTTEEDPSTLRATSLVGLTTIDVWFHVIQSGPALSQGNVPEAWLDAQIRELNDAYGDATALASSRFNFVKRGVTRTTNGTWFNLTPATPASANELAMKQALHQGGATTLNIYTMAPGAGVLGWATNPAQLSGTNGAVLDGVVVHYNSFPGGTELYYDQGMTAVHEAGHWLGLYHPWRNGCSSVGDEVSDTPAMDDAWLGCPAQTVDSCPSMPGTDPVRNYMGYTDDICMWEFTSGQVARMANLYSSLRGTLGTVNGYTYEGLWQHTITSTIYGGAYDSDTPSSAIQVRAYWDGAAGSGASYTQVTANEANGYINEIYGVAGNHGFTITVPTALRDGQPHKVYIYGVDSGSGPMSHLMYGALSFTINP
ncbi:zinc metalloprotease [Myxococcus llanfairpwllgwyngyllgogerychwyrndrobwllllantysiliogogogochensis]|uniref:Zinc metalloprotease n=1 Tax=Myxococcus llanfairpwllgwyngyllgogerychwyrndrobwllllantysiliogogogochensis TaxID=2590453 RepID=A0A540WXR5_9BACT|nr:MULTISPECIES: zinc metalloprotease [Myxococcus]NTX11817.1 zinc metalloprotease [Myxococcus sp. CA056]TQF13234.1 zinc metalloprotease [Myxococcus llanfairpwllgwyngyllgogerychwyrndrobwllllantysiliogogogochensis]